MYVYNVLSHYYKILSGHFNDFYLSWAFSTWAIGTDHVLLQTLMHIVNSLCACVRTLYCTTISTAFSTRPLQYVYTHRRQQLNSRDCRKLVFIILNFPETYTPYFVTTGNVFLPGDVRGKFSVWFHPRN